MFIETAPRFLVLVFVFVPTGIIEDRRGDTFSVYEMATEMRDRAQMEVSNDDVRAALDILVLENVISEGSAGGYRKRRR